LSGGAVSASVCLDIGKEDVMGVIVVLLLLALIFGGLGFAIHALWIVAVVFLVAWIVGFAFGRGRSKSARA
jgi:multisubunit Na+/H+ antiporter MnhG subunit